MGLDETKILKTISAILAAIPILLIVLLIIFGGTPGSEFPSLVFIMWSLAMIVYVIAKKYEKPAGSKNPTLDENLLKQKEQELRIRELELRIQKMEEQSARK